MKLGLPSMLIGGAMSHGGMIRPLPRQNQEAADDWDGLAKQGLLGCGGESCYYFNQQCVPGCGCGSGCNRAQERKTGPGCNLGCKMEPTHSDARSYGIDDPKDGTKYHPWRAPGHTTLENPCGLNKGHFGNFTGPSKGSDLPVHKDKIEAWSAGGTAWASWSLFANHAGGYQYRLCPKSKTLTDECFEGMPLEFATHNYTISWTTGIDHTNQTTGEDVVLEAVELSTGTKPAGSIWRRNPVPADASFMPPAVGVSGITAGASVMHSHPGIWNFYISDELRVPNQEGEFVLQWRWDCEESAQIWASCADVKITSNDSAQIAV